MRHTLCTTVPHHKCPRNGRCKGLVPKLGHQRQQLARNRLRLIHTGEIDDRRIWCCELSIVLVIVALIVVVFFSQQLIKGTIGFSCGVGVSAFLIGTLFPGFDPENLAVGAIGTVRGVDAIADGTIIGSVIETHTRTAPGHRPHGPILAQHSGVR